MRLEYVKAISSVVLLVVTFLTTMLPLFLFRKRTPRYPPPHEEMWRKEGRERVMSFLNCFAAGVFLATCLLHLFPDVQEQMDRIFKDLGIVPNYPVAEFLFGFGFLTILIVEQIITNCQEHSRDMDIDNDQVPIRAPEPSPPEPSHENTSLTGDRTTNYGTIQEENPFQIITNCQEHSRDMDIDDDQVPILPPEPSPPVPSHENTSLTGDRTTNYGTIQEDNPEVTFTPTIPLSSSTLRSLLLVLALSLHSVFEGLAIGLQTTAQSEIRILLAVLIHKCIIAFSLGLNLTSSQMRNASVVRSNLTFSLTSPIGILIGMVVVDFVHGVAMVITSGILQGLAAGTFLYITLFEVLPRELACGKDRMVKMACVVLGYSVVSLLLTFLPE